MGLTADRASPGGALDAAVAWRRAVQRVHHIREELRQVIDGERESDLRINAALIVAMQEADQAMARFDVALTGREQPVVPRRPRRPKAMA